MSGKSLKDPVFLERFWSSVGPMKPGNCWEWQACRSNKDYGAVFCDGRQQGAHRVMWRLMFGEIPKGLCVCHCCDNPSCVNPAHLFLGTHKDNANDRDKKGRLNHLTRRKPIVPPTNTKFTENQIKEIRARAEKGEAAAAMAREFDVWPETISNIIHRKTWRHV